MNIACCQFDIAWLDKSASHAKVAEMVERAHLSSGTLLLLPEMFDTGFSMNVAAISDGADAAGAGRLGVSGTFLSQLAKRHHLYVLGGCVSTGADGRGRNQAAIFGPDGTEMARFTKLHSFGMAGESAHFTQGSGVQVVSIANWLISPLICYDLRFPEAFRAGVRRGAQLFAVIANWPASRQMHWQTLLRARAIENQAYVAAVNRCGADPQTTYAGGSAIIDPRGEIVAQAHDGQEIIQADIELEKVEQGRRRFTAVKDMRSDLL